MKGPAAKRGEGRGEGIGFSQRSPDGGDRTSGGMKRATAKGPAAKRGEGIGFSQRIRLDWLEYTANAVLAGSPEGEIVTALRERLRERFSLGGDRVSGNRDKAVSILTRVWVTVPDERRTLRDEGLDLLRQADANDRMLVHWCMCMAVYPFFGAVADTAGRLLRLQGTAAAAQVQRRLRERLGERETVARAARRVLRTFIDWGVLVETGGKGFYRGAAKRVVGHGPTAVWVLKAMLSAGGGTLQSPAALLRTPGLFPFEIASPPPAELEACGAFEVVRDGLDHEMLLGLASTATLDRVRRS